MKSECYPISTLPQLSRIFLDYCEHHTPLAPFFSSTPFQHDWHKAVSPITHRQRLAELLRQQKQSPNATAAIGRLERGAQAVVTGQQVAIFGGPLYTALKAATAVRRAREASAAGHGHVPIFWLASEDHDFDEINHVTIPSGRVLHSLTYTGEHAPGTAVGGILLNDKINALVEDATSILGPGDVVDTLRDAYRPGRTLAQAFASFLTSVFSEQGLIVIDAASRGIHALGRDVLYQAIERAAELNKALRERDRQLAEAGYHSQVLVAENSSLLFLVDTATGARLPLKRNGDGRWTANRAVYADADLIAILDHEPERLSPSALLRPVFQDAILPTSAYIAGPAEIAYFAQTQVLYEKILGRATPVLPRLSATIIEPEVAALLKRHELPAESVIGKTQPDLALRLAARYMPIEGKQKIAAAGNALDRELTALTDWMHSVDAGLGRSADTSARKMRYQMNRLRRIAATFELQKEASLTRQAQAIVQSIYPEGHPQERVIAAAYLFAKYGTGLASDIVDNAGGDCPGHKIFYL